MSTALSVFYYVGESCPGVWVMRSLYHVYTYYAIAFLFVHCMVLIRAVIIITITTFMPGGSTMPSWVTGVPTRGSFISIFSD